MTFPIMTGADPYTEYQSDKGILFLHGFTGSPHEHRWMAREFAGMGYSVSVPLLAGHGTSPQDLKETTWLDWYTSARQALFDLKKKSSNIVIVGLSMGGTMALHLSAHYEVDGVAALASPLFLNDWKLKFLPVMKHILTEKPKRDGADIKDPLQKQKAVHYMTQPLRSIEQLLKLFNHVKDDLPDIHVPVLLVNAVQDHVVPFENREYIKQNINSKDVRELTLHDCYHIITLDTEREKVLNTLKIFIEDIIGKP